MERGFSLIEMVVATAIFAMAASVAFILYTAAQKSYKAGENSSDQQQSTRVAFDRMLSDVRLAGYNTNPDGDTTRVDEQIEGAWDTAVTVRGDFDREDPTASLSPESALAGTVYNSVSTGNDEIVTYVLSKPGVTSTGTMDLWLDVDKPRVKTVKQVTIPKVALIQDNPPYTLYRVTMADVNGTFPTTPQASTNFIYEPVADNIKSMTFLYYDDSGTLISPNTPTNSADDIAGTAANQITRARIKRISISLVGMTRDPDMNYVDTTDANAATQAYRKFDLSSDVNPENLGKSGIKDVDVSPPPAPTGVGVVPGHCKGMLVTWNQPASTDGVSAYVVRFWPDSSPTTITSQSFTYPHNEYGTIDYLGHAFVTGLNTTTPYHFQVQAKDAAGNQSAWAPSGGTGGTVTDNLTTTVPYTNPAAPTGLALTSNQDSQIPLTWAQLKTNTNVLTGDPNTIGGNTILRDPKGYRLEKSQVSASSGFMTVVDAPPAVPSLGPGNTSYLDTPVANCKTYYYRLVAIDTCDKVSGYSNVVSGQAYTTVKPAIVTGVGGDRTSQNNITITWTPVTTNVNGTTIAVDQYKVYRYKGPKNSPPATSSFTYLGSSTTASYVDALSAQDKQDLNGQSISLYYYVTAVDFCPNESDPSTIYEVYCASNLGPLFTPPDGGSGGGNQLIRLTYTPSGSTVVTRVRVHIARLSGSGDIYDQTVQNAAGLASPIDLPLWNSSAEGGGAYTLNWEIETNKGCIQLLPKIFNAAAAASCKISATNPTIAPVSGKPSAFYTVVAWDIQNYSGDNLDIFEIDVQFTSTAGTGTHKLQKLAWPSTATAMPGLKTFSPAVASPGAYFPVLGAITFASTTPIINMSLTFDSAMLNSSTGNTETMVVTYRFQDSSFTSGICALTIIQGP